MTGIDSHEQLTAVITELRSANVVKVSVFAAEPPHPLALARGGRAAGPSAPNSRTDPRATASAAVGR
jgi:hypothetical protein